MPDLAGLISDLFDIKRRVAGTVRYGVITDVKDGKVRFSLGKKEDGSDHKSPWLFPAQHNGLVSEDTPYKVGQNIAFMTPGGDLRQAVVLPYAPNKDNKRPDHASDTARTRQIRPASSGSAAGGSAPSAAKPGLQVTEKSGEQTTEVDKTSKRSQTASSNTDEVKASPESKQGSSNVQTATSRERKFTDAAGTVLSLLSQTAAQVLNRVGTNSSVSLTATTFQTSIAGISSITQSAAGILKSIGGVSQLVSLAGTAFTGGQVLHDAINIGKDHLHFMVGRFGGVTGVPISGPPPASPWGGDTGGPEPGSLDALVPFAMGRFDGAGTLHGRHLNVAGVLAEGDTSSDPDHPHPAFLVTLSHDNSTATGAAPDTEYQVYASGAAVVSIVNVNATQFRITTDTEFSRLSFQVLA